MTRGGLLEEDSIYFYGDLSSDELSNYLIDTYGDELCTNIVQPGHPGNCGLPISLYEFVKLEIILFDAPELMMSDEKHNVEDLKAWCDENNIKVYNYFMIPNIIKECDLHH